MNAAELARRFTFHPPGDDTERVARHERIRAAGRTLAELLVDLVPESPELRRAIDAVDDAVMLANAGLARGGVIDFGKIMAGTVHAEMTFGSISACPPHERGAGPCPCTKGQCVNRNRCLCTGESRQR